MIPYDGKAISSIMGMDCVKTTAVDTTFYCDLAGYDFQIFELKLKADLATWAISKDAETQYQKYGDSIGFRITSSPGYFAIAAGSIEDNFKRILLFKRKTAAGDNSNVFYSLDVSLYAGSKSLDQVLFLVYNHPLDQSPKILVQDSVSSSLAAIFNITEMKLDIGMVGYYEMDSLRTTNLTVNRGLSLQNASFSVYDVFFNPQTPNKDVKDRVYTNYFYDYIWWWVALIVILVVSILVVVVYFIRRDSADKYNSSF